MSLGLDWSDTMERSQAVTNGRGADALRENRPGVPREARPHTTGNLQRASDLTQQRTQRASLISPSLELTPIYSSVQPPRGLSGVVRRAAYRYPEYRARRWMMLMFADRIDVLEHNPAKAALLAGSLGAFGYMLYKLTGRPRARARVARRLAS